MNRAEDRMIRRIDHIAIGVRDLEKAKRFFLQGLGGREIFSAPAAAQGYNATTLELGTSCFIELLNPVGEGFLERFLDSRGEGPHHITLQVDGIREVLRLLEGKGIRTFGFSEALPSGKEFFIHPRDAFGTLIQFAEFDPLTWINPGYIPAAYREFAPPERVGSEEDGIEVRNVGDRDGGELEIRRGGEAVRIPANRVRDLIQALQRIENDTPPKPERS